jgi:phospho-N-acetylmuramoyl-pentapeptide-transferase
MSTEVIPLGEVYRGWEPFFVAFGAAAIAAWPVYRMLVRLGSRQKVSEYVPEHAGKQGTPTMGGLIVLAGLLAVAAVYFDPWLLPVWIATGIFGAIGFLDDFVVPRLMSSKRGLGWLPKLGLQLIGAAVLPLWDLRGDGSWVAIGVEIFLLLFFVNAFNFADGLDGLAGGLLVALCAGAAAMALIVSSPLALLLCAAMLGSILPFLFLNAPPAKVFMGDVGSMPLGYLLGVVSVQLLVGAGRSGVTTLLTIAILTIWALVLVAELVPVPIQILSVKLRGKRIFPKTPIHHAFESAGVPETRIVWWFLLVQTLLSIAAVYVLAGAVAGAQG